MCDLDVSVALLALKPPPSGLHLSQCLPDTKFGEGDLPMWPRLRATLCWTMTSPSSVSYAGTKIWLIREEERLGRGCSTHGTGQSPFGAMLVSRTNFRDLDNTILKFRHLNIKIRDLGPKWNHHTNLETKALYAWQANVVTEYYIMLQLHTKSSRNRVVIHVATIFGVQ